MATYKFMEISIEPNKMERYVGSTDIYNEEYVSYNYATFACVKAVAKRCLTKGQYEAIILPVTQGWRQKDIARLQGVSQQAISDRRKRALARLRGIYSLYLKNRR